MKKKVVILTNNVTCIILFQNIAKIEKYFMVNGWEISEDMQSADKVVICGCGFIEGMFRKIQNTLAYLKNIGFPEENIIIFGCVSTIYKDVFQESFHGELIENSNYSKIDDLINAEYKFDDISPANTYVMPQKPKDRYHIKVMQGCMMKCTYCVIKKATGYANSYSPEVILEQARNANIKGYKKIFLLAEDTLAYGVDNGENLIDIMNAIMEINPSFEIELDNFHPMWLSKYKEGLIDLCRRRALKMIYTPIQHINPRILRKMGRGDDFSEIYSILKTIKSEVPSVKIHTDIIVGFPGESKQDFEELEEFFRGDKVFDVVNHTAYSDNPRAQSYQFDGKVNPQIATFRWCALAKILGSRSPYNNQDSLENLNNIERNYFICKDVYKET